MKNLIKENITKGMVFENPGGGTSTVVNVTDTYISYKRKNSNMKLNISEIEAIYDIYKGKEVTSTELKKYKSKVFSSDDGGHSCNCTFLFLVLEKLGYTIGSIKGRGKRGNPFYIEIQ